MRADLLSALWIYRLLDSIDPWICRADPGCPDRCWTKTMKKKDGRLRLPQWRRDEKYEQWTEQMYCLDYCLVVTQRAYLVTKLVRRRKYLLHIYIWRRRTFFRLWSAANVNVAGNSFEFPQLTRDAAKMCGFNICRKSFCVLINNCLVDHCYDHHHQIFFFLN